MDTPPMYHPKVPIEIQKTYKDSGILRYEAVHMKCSWIKDYRLGDRLQRFFNL